MPSPPNATDGVILPEALYTLPEIQRRTGLGVAAMRMARRDGLRVRYLSRRAYVKGADIIAHIESRGRDEK